MQTDTSDYESPLRWKEDYLRKLIQKNAEVKKRRDAIKKSRVRYIKFNNSVPEKVY